MPTTTSTASAAPAAPGLSGTAITIVAPADKKAVAAIETLTGQTISWMGEPPRADEAEAPERHERPRHGRSHRGDHGKGKSHGEGRGPRGPKPDKRREAPQPTSAARRRNRPSGAMPHPPR